MIEAPGDDSPPHGSGPDLPTTATTEIDRVLGSLLVPGEPVSLLNFADHANVGDAAIWLGQLATLRRLGHPVAHQCAWWGHDPDELRRRHPTGPILINGGGNFGDRYPQHGTRLAIVADFPDRRIIQLPQSIHFDEPARAEATVAAWNRHPDIHLLLRETPSRIVADELGLASASCPDMALALGPIERPRAPEVPVLWLRRRDGESVMPRPADLDVDAGQVRIHDWLQSVPRELRWSARARRARRIDARARQGGGRRRSLGPAFETLARHWTDRGLDLLSRGQVVVTDRLHAHLLATLLGIPNVVMDNSTGKVRAVYEDLSHRSPLAHWADDPAEALDLAFDLAPGADDAPEATADGR